MKHIAPQNACGACCTQIDHVSVHLEGLPVLENISLHLHCGEMTAIIGPNGAGKTTLFRAILQQVPYQGSIQFTDSTGSRMGNPRIGYVPQHLRVEPMAPVTVLDFMGAALSHGPSFFKPSPQKKELVLDALRRTDATQLLNRRIGALSGGEVQRVLLALALCPMPDLLLLDEPVSGIDAEGLHTFYSMIDLLRRDYDISILLISHDFAFIHRYADSVVLLHHQVLDHSTPDAVLEGAAFATLFPGHVKAKVVYR